MLRENKGVTLVALVITIIVLLILAGVSISLVVGDNGVLNQAVNAADETNRAAVQSELEMAVTAAATDYLSEKVQGNLSDTDQTIEEYLNTDSGAKVKGYMSSDFSQNCTFDCDAYSASSTANTTITYKGETYSFFVRASESGNSALVTYIVPSNE